MEKHLISGRNVSAHRRRARNDGEFDHPRVLERIAGKRMAPGTAPCLRYIFGTASIRQRSR